MASKRTVCTRGHDMSVTRKFHPNGDSYCSECKAIRQQQDKIKYPKRHLEYYKTSKRRKNYGLSKEDYEKLVEQADNKCMICGGQNKSKSLHIDHCHATKKVRGLLCHGCNTALGLFKENIETMLKAIEYLKKGK